MPTLAACSVPKPADPLAGKSEACITRFKEARSNYCAAKEELRHIPAPKDENEPRSPEYAAAYREFADAAYAVNATAADSECGFRSNLLDLKRCDAP